MGDAQLKDQDGGANVVKELPELLLSDPNQFEALLDPRSVGKAVRDGLAALANGKTYGAKAIVQPADEEILSLIGAESLDQRFSAERLNWKLNALVSANERYGAVKIVGSNAYNRLCGLPRSRSIIVLYDKLTMQPISIMEGTAISNRRTGAYASLVADLALAHKDRLSVFLFGAGRVSEAIVDDLHAHHGERIECVFVKSRSQESAEAFAEHVASRVSIPIEPVGGLNHLPLADFVITASNARNPLFAGDEIGDDAVLLHLGGDETPASFVRRALETGTVICDDASTVCHRNSQSLALYFSRQGELLSELASTFQVVNLWEALQQAPTRYRPPVFVTCVGLPILDLYLAQWVYESLVSGRREGRMDVA